MIRPIMNEDNLQKLETLELEDLRAEFVEQVMTLRRKVLNNINPKMINGCQIEGSLWINMAEQYLNAINSDDVPNILDSWTYICKEKAVKALQESKAKFDFLVEQVEGKKNSEAGQPLVNDRDCKQIVEEASEEAQHEFITLARGDSEVIQEYQKELDNYIEERSEEIIETNLFKCRKFATDLLNQLFLEA